MAIMPDKRDGKLTGRWRVELQLHGQRVRRRFDTMEEARDFEAKTRVQMAQGVIPPEAKLRDEGPKVETLEQLIRAAQGHLWAGDATERGSMQILERAFRIIGYSRIIESVTVSDTDRLVKFLREKGNAPGTINRYLSAFTTAMKWAKKRGYRVSPHPACEWQDEDEGRIRWITPVEEQKLLSLMAMPEALAVFISIRTGLRRGELLNLQPRDVEPQWVHLWGTGTKSGKGRSIPITVDVYNALHRYFSLGKVTEDSLRHHWNTAREAMGLLEDEDFVFHACRHTFATRAVQAGVHPRVLQRLMGHKHLSTTMRYMQVSDGMLTAAIEQMSAVQNPTGTISIAHPMDGSCGGLQVGENSLNPPINTARKTDKTLRKQGVKLDLGSSGVTRGGSSPSARTK